MKGIVLAGGKGTRLAPITTSISKQLVPIYDKPMIYFPVSTLMLAGVTEILFISTPRDLPMLQGLMGDGKRLGMEFSYAEQKEPKGIAEAFIVGEEFINNEPVCMILGDNLFYGWGLPSLLWQHLQLDDGAVVFAYQVREPNRYGVIEFDKNGKALSIEEKPKQPKSNWAVTGLYFYDGNVAEMAKSLKPSARGELEITDLNKKYLDAGKLHVECLGRGTAWLDTGTADSLLSASTFVQTLEQRQGLKLACLEEIAYRRKLINKQQLVNLAEEYADSSYGMYLKQIAEEEKQR